MHITLDLPIRTIDPSDHGGCDQAVTLTTMTAGDILRTAEYLADQGHTDPDALTHADVDMAADLAGAGYPSAHDRHMVRLALDTWRP